jgi:DNA-binding transcriptional LysR family regulator
MDLNDILIFVKVAQTGSFSGAARQLNLPVSTVSRRVAELERSLGVGLLIRTTRSVKLTEMGRATLQHGLAISAELERATALASSVQSIPQGLLRLTATADFGNRYLAEIISEFIKAHPRVQVEVELTDRVVDLVSEGFDLAVRMGELSDSGDLARKIGKLNLHLFASPSFLKKNGEPKSCKDLSRFDCIRFTGEDEPDCWNLQGPRGHQKVRVQGRLISNDLMLIRKFAILGEGVALMPYFFCTEDLKAGRLKLILQDWAHSSGPVHVVYPGQKFILPRVKAFVEHLTRTCHKIEWDRTRE